MNKPPKTNRERGVIVDLIRKRAARGPFKPNDLCPPLTREQAQTNCQRLYEAGELKIAAPSKNGANGTQRTYAKHDGPSMTPAAIAQRKHRRKLYRLGLSSKGYPRVTHRKTDPKPARKQPTPAAIELSPMESAWRQFRGGAEMNSGMSH